MGSDNGILQDPTHRSRSLQHPQLSAWMHWSTPTSSIQRPVNYCTNYVHLYCKENQQPWSLHGAQTSKKPSNAVSSNNPRAIKTFYNQNTCKRQQQQAQKKMTQPSLILDCSRRGETEEDLWVFLFLLLAVSCLQDRFRVVDMRLITASWDLNGGI